MKKLAESIRRLPPKYKGTPRPTIAVAGRSNVGKSTLINAILGRKAAATSKTPGRTRGVQRFLINERYDLVDLPGYGFAKVGEELRRSWRAAVTDFLSGHGNLRQLLVLVDIRRGVAGIDRELFAWAQLEQVEVSVVLTKVDKLSRMNRLKAVKKVRDETDENIAVFPVSALKGDGLEQLARAMLEWWSEDSFGRE